MKKLFFCLLILKNLVSFGQGVYKEVNNPQTFRWLKVESSFAIPHGDTVLNTNDLTPGHLKWRNVSGDGTLYVWDGSSWVGVGGGGSANFSAIYGGLWLTQVNDSTLQADSSAMAAYFLRRADSTTYYPYRSNPLGYLTSASLSGYELLANKAINFGVINNTKYPTTSAVVNYVTGLGYLTTAVTNFSAGDLSPLFTTSEATTTSTPALSFTASTAAAYKVYGTGSSTAVPSFIGSLDSNYVLGMHTQPYYDARYLSTGDSTILGVYAPITLTSTGDTIYIGADTSYYAATHLQSQGRSRQQTDSLGVVIATKQAALSGIGYLKFASTTPSYIPTIPLADGGTNASLTASNGGIFYSTASAGAILSGTATANKILLSGATAAPTWSTSTIPTSAGATANKVLLSDGTNYVLSTPTFPNASATTRKIIVSDGTNWIASTETYAVPGTSGNVLTSDGINWISSAASGGSGWALTGNAGITAYTNFLGTTDSKSLWMRTNNVPRVVVDSVGLVGINKTVPVSTLDIVQTTPSDPAYGSEVLDNTGWTATNYTGTWSTGYTHTTGNTSVLSRTGAATISTAYRIGVTITGRTAGTITISYGGVSSAALTATGEYSLFSTSTGTLTITPTSTFDGTMFLTVKTISGSSTPLLTMAATTGSTIQFRTDTTGNIFMGSTAGALTQSGSGAGGAVQNLDGTNNVGVGFGVMALNINGGGNVAMGSGALSINRTGSLNVAVGTSSMIANTTGYKNIAMGGNALGGNTAGVGNIGIGDQSGVGNTNGASNIFIGAHTVNNTSNKIIMGSGLSVTPSTGSVYEGNGNISGTYTSTGIQNTFVGNDANTFVGNASTGASQTGLGYAVMRNVNGSFNTGIGEDAGSGLPSFVTNYINSGSYNTYGGYRAGRDITQSVTYSGSLFLGANAKELSASADNQLGLYVGGASAYPAIYGFNSGGILINRNKTTTPTETASAALEINGTTGALIVPRVTKVQRDAMTKTAGMIIFQTDNTPGLRTCDGTNWYRYTETVD